MIHRKILDIAEANPDASLDAIASELDGASVAFVERVLNEYGDPANRNDQPSRTNGVEQNSHAANSSEEVKARTNGTDDGDVTDSGHEAETEDADGSEDPDEEGRAKAHGEGATAAPRPGERDPDEPESGSDGIPDPSQLSEKQCETLLAVRERPSATQAEIGDELDVSRATVSKRLKDVPGFDWATRRQFVNELFDTGKPGSDAETDVPREEQRSVTPGAVAELAERVETLESEFERRSVAGDTRAADPELVHKVIHACMEAEYVSEDEELRILHEVLPTAEKEDAPDQTKG